MVVVEGGRSYMVLRSTISTQFQHLRSSAGAVRVGHPYGTSGGDSSCTTTVVKLIIVKEVISCDVSPVAMFKALPLVLPGYLMLRKHLVVDHC